MNSEETLKKEIRQLRVFYNYFMEFYGQNLQVANWHLNDTLEPLDAFIEQAKVEMEETE